MDIKTRAITLFICIIVALSACNTNRLNSDTQEILHLEDCQLSAPGIAVRLKARCGKLQVLENRQAPEGRTIELNLAIIPAISRNPEPDALYFLAGGPGEAATQSYLAVYPAFDKINQKRDIVLIDQRGTGGSNPLNCPTFTADETTQAFLDYESTPDYWKKCLDQLDGDVRFYTTSIAMDDLDQVRAYLGHSKINLYGASYGTRAALSYARQYPSHVRTIILDGVVPPDWPLGPDVSRNAQRALDMIFERCNKEIECQRNFPDLKNEFIAMVNNLASSPVMIEVTHPVSGEEISFTITKDVFANTVHLLSYSPETAAILPAIIHYSYAKSNYKRFAEISLANTSVLENSISNGMRFSVLCAEDVPFYPTSGISDEGYLGDFIPKAFFDVCKNWPTLTKQTHFHQPVYTQTPVLLLSGEADPVTPPENGYRASQTLPNSIHLIIPGMGHINIFRGCIPRLSAEFIEKGSMEGIDTQCASHIAPMPLFINLNGPQP